MGLISNFFFSTLYPSPCICFNITDNCLPAIMYMNMLNSYFLLSFALQFLQSGCLLNKNIG